MGIYDRDYMKRRPDDGPGRHASPDEKLDAALGGIGRRFRTVGIILVVIVAVLIIAGLLLALFP